MIHKVERLISPPRHREAGQINDDPTLPPSCAAASLPSPPGRWVGCSGSALLGLSLLSGVVAAAGGNLAGPVRIGFQKAGTVLVSLKTKGILEKQLQLKGATIQWSEFPAGLPMVEALNAGAIDIAYVGEAPPVFAQAANDSVTRYVAYDPFGPDGEGIVVQNDSKIKKLSDLRGKKIAVQSGNPLPEARRCPLSLQPGLSRCLGDWDPFNAATSAQSDVRVLRTSEGLVSNRDFYLANKSFAQENPDVIKGLRKQTQVVSRWANRNEEKVVSFFSPLLKIDASVLKVVVNRRDFSYIPFTPKVVEEQQELADQFFKLKLIPKMSMLATWWTSSSSGRRLNLS